METGESLTEEGGEYASDGLSLSGPHLFSSERVMAPIQHERASFLSPSSTTLPLPPGWTEEVSTSGHTYFADHISHITTWDDPRAQRALVLTVAYDSPTFKFRICLP